MANHYWIETQRYEWPAALARLMLLLVAAILIVLIAGCHSAPSMGPDVHVTIEQKTSIPDCGQITPATAKPGCSEPAEQQATECVSVSATHCLKPLWVAPCGRRPPVKSAFLAHDC